MADDLITRSLLRGKSRDEVLSMLGQPHGSGELKHRSFTYHLGSRSFDSERLVVRFDDEDSVADYRIVSN